MFSFISTILIHIILKIISSHVGSAKYFNQATLIFVKADRLASEEIQQKDTSDFLASGGGVSNRDKWEITHQHLIEQVTFESFAEAIGIPSEEIEKLPDVPSLTDVQRSLSQDL